MASGDPEEPDDGAVLAPDELDISQDENVLEIDEGRYVISPDDNQSPTPTDSIQDVEEDSPPDSNVERNRNSLERGDIHDWLRQDFSDTDTQYGFDVTAKFDDSITQQRLVSNDVVTIFENLILWYAQQVGGDTPVEEVLGILLSEANVPIRYPHRTLVALIKFHDLDGSNSIEELLQVVEKNEGVLLPPSNP